MKTLPEYLAAKGMSQTAFAEQIGISRSYLSEIVSGPKKPSLSVAAKIERATGGAVSIASFVTSDDLPESAS